MFNLPNGLNEKDYWIIRVSGIEWNFLMHKLIAETMKEIAPKEYPVIIIATNDDPFFLLKRVYVPVDVLASKTGLTIPDLQQAPVIELMIKTRKDLPEPTVQGWGEA